MPDHWAEKLFPWSDIPRFYPPGEHPAVRRYVETLRLAREHREVYGESAAITEVIAYCEDHIAAFEQVESELKAAAALRR